MPEKDKTKKNPPENFEEGLNELEELVEKIERGELELEESLEIFDRASFLSKWCMDFLKKAEKKIKVLLPNEEGDFKLEDFESENQ